MLYIDLLTLCFFFLWYINVSMTKLCFHNKFQFYLTTSTLRLTVICHKQHLFEIDKITHLTICPLVCTHWIWHIKSYWPGYSSSLYIGLYLWDIGKQYSLRCDATECGTPYWAILLTKNKIKITHSVYQMEVDSQDDGQVQYLS